MDLDRSPEQLLKAGLAALKQQDYGRAISIFQQLPQKDDISISHRLKAQMGLIRAHEAQGNHVQARTLCKPLLKSRSQTIRQWAHDKFQQLTIIEKPSLKQPTTDDRNTSQISANKSGFVPFTSDESPSQKFSNTSPQSNIANPQHQYQKLPKEQSTTNKTSTKKTSSQTTGSSITNLNPYQPSKSLFHYQSLNNTQVFEGKTGIISTFTEKDSNSETASEATLPKQLVTELPQTPPKKTTTLLAETNTTSGPETWPQGSRLTTLKSLGKMSTGRLWFAQLATIPIFFLVVRWLIKATLALTRNYFLFLNQLLPFNVRLPDFFWGTQTWTVIIGLGLLTIVAPWLWPLLLHPSQRLTAQQLQSYSPEAKQLLHRFCSKRRWPVPSIQLIPNDLPLIFSYGWRPRYGQLVVSQGLLDRLAADELAAVMMYEMSHWPNLDWIFFSTHGLLLQIFHRAYWFLAHWGENHPNLLKMMAGIVANLSYCIFLLLTQVGCWLARTRTPYRDRNTTELTGNPNGLIRALAKLSATMANAIHQQGYTPPLVESLNVMLPVGPSSVNSSIQHHAWGAFNPLRHWLSLNQVHPPLGDRLYTLNAYGRHWQLKPSLNYAQLKLKHSSRAFTLTDWNNLLRQGGAWSGLMIGLIVAVTMWIVGAISTQFDIPLLSWLYKDRSIIMSMPLIGTATGHLLRINPFFPEIDDSIATDERQLTIWQTDPTLIPINSLPIKLQGTLKGRPALANWLGQEWRLYTNHGSIKLHYTSYLGPLSNIQGLAPWLNTPLQVTGWFRRGHHIWIDIDHIQNQQNQTKLARHPLWATIISALPLIYGLWVLFKGG